MEGVKSIIWPKELNLDNELSNNPGKSWRLPGLEVPH